MSAWPHLTELQPARETKPRNPPLSPFLWWWCWILQLMVSSSELSDAPPDTVLREGPPDAVLLREAPPPPPMEKALRDSTAPPAAAADAPPAAPAVVGLPSDLDPEPSPAGPLPQEGVIGAPAAPKGVAGIMPEPPLRRALSPLPMPEPPPLRWAFSPLPISEAAALPSPSKRSPGCRPSPPPLTEPPSPGSCLPAVASGAATAAAAWTPLAAAAAEEEVKGVPRVVGGALSGAVKLAYPPVRLRVQLCSSPRNCSRIL